MKLLPASLSRNSSQRILRFVHLLLGMVLCALLATPALAQAVDAHRIELTAEESAWLKAHPKLSFCFSDSFRAFLTLDADKQPVGYWPDLYRLLGERLGVPLTIPVSPWPKAVEEAKARQCTGLAAVKAVDMWREEFLFSDPLRATFMYIYTRSEQAETLRQLTNLYGKKVGYLLSEAGAEALLKKHPQITGVPYQSNLAQMAALQSGEVVASLGSISMEVERQQNNLHSLKLAALIPESRTQLVIAVRKDWPELVPILNKALASLTQDEKRQLEDRWFGDRARQLLATDTTVSLTQIEQDWLAQGRIVRVRVVDNPPYTITKPTPSGISVDTLDAIGKRLGFKAEYVVNELGWEAALTDVRGKRQHYDLLLTVGRTPERENDFAFTNDYLSAPWVIYTRNDSHYVTSIAGLNGMTVAAEHGYVATARLEADYPGIKLLKVSRTEDALRALATGQADAYVGNLSTTSYMIKMLQLNNLMVAAPTPFGENRVAMAVRKDWAILAGLIDKGLAAMTQDERNARQEKWGKIDTRLQVDYTLIAWIVAVAALIILVIVVQNKRHTKELRQLAFKDALTQLPNRRLLLDRLERAIANSKRHNSHGAVLFLDLNKFKQLNDTHGHDVGDLLLQEVARRLNHMTRAADTVARLGGDEFVVLLEGLEADTGKASEFATTIANKIRQALTEDYVLGAIRHHGSASIGIRLFLGDAADADQLLKDADAAMYESKRTGKTDLAPRRTCFIADR